MVATVIALSWLPNGEYAKAAIVEGEQPGYWEFSAAL
jgi:hypothetical protein